MCFVRYYIPRPHNEAPSTTVHIEALLPQKGYPQKKLSVSSFSPPREQRTSIRPKKVSKVSSCLRIVALCLDPFGPSTRLILGFDDCSPTPPQILLPPLPCATQPRYPYQQPQLVRRQVSLCIHDGEARRRRLSNTISPRALLCPSQLPVPVNSCRKPWLTDSPPSGRRGPMMLPSDSSS